ncbi:D-alanine--D-alanine ligase A [Chromobacterium violaceum]|uniref:D-alanine--D-alanine ligase A n=1 Tax=Chromobacterium violaceum TaxID=536 RepID=A0A3S4LKW8_CHRVL|nr:D-alanine--D-alanine ligase A [Chromobacterium violaceum]
MGKIRVGLIFGGQSSEHEVSLQSARNILQAIDGERFEVSLIGVDKQGRWHASQASNFLLNADDPGRIALRESGENLALVPGECSGQLQTAANAHPLAQIDVAFPSSTARWARTARCKACCEWPTSPSSARACWFGGLHGQGRGQAPVARCGLKVAPFVSLTRSKAAGADLSAIVEQLGLPLFVKPANQGSSVG